MSYDRLGTGTPGTTASMSRRQYLAVGATVGVTAVAGCSTAVDLFGGMVLEERDEFDDVDF